jgi:hypothetical protein
MSESSKIPTADEIYQRFMEHERQKVEAKKTRLFNPKEAAKDASEARYLQDEQLGVIEYGSLTLKEFKEITSKHPSKEEKAYHLVHKMLQKRDPSLTYEEVEGMPFEVVARLSKILGDQLSAFLPRQTSQTSPSSSSSDSSPTSTDTHSSTFLG